MKNRLLPRAYVYSHFAKHVTGSTRLGLSSPTFKEGTEKPLEATAYIKGDSLIVMAIDTTKTAHTLNLTLPYKVKSGVYVLSTGNETANLCQQSDIEIEEPTLTVSVSMPARSLNTYIFMIDREEETGITELQPTINRAKRNEVYDMNGKLVLVGDWESASSTLPKGFYIEKRADGTTHKVFIEN